MKFVIAMMKHETNTFSPQPTGRDKFGPGGPLSGDKAIAEYQGANQAIAAFFEAARRERAEFTVPMAAGAHPSGKVASNTFEEMAGAICAAVAKGCDAAMLDLHGAMVTDDSFDGEGELLSRIRKIAPQLPIAVALDFHTNLTEAMVANSTVITGYRTYPHIDVADTGRRAAATLIRALKGEINPVMAWGNRPMLTHTLKHTPAREPMRSIMALANQQEDGGQVLNAAVFGGFQLADIPHTALSAVVTTDADKPAGQKLVERLLDMAWRERAGFVYSGEKLEISIAQAKKLDGGPVVLVDHGDNTASGGTQDVMGVLEEAIRQGLTDLVAGPFCDPQSVAQMIAAGVGGQVNLMLGGKVDMPSIGLKGKPLKIAGKVHTITDGEFVVTGPMSTGSRVRMGRSAVLDTGTMLILVSEKRSEPFDLGIFRHAGIEPTAHKFVLIKSRQHFRAGFEPIAKHIVECQGQGVTAADFALFPFKNLKRPIYPLDPNATDRPNS